MTTTDAPAFAHAYDGLALAFRVPASRDGGADQRQIYYEALADLPVAAIVDAAAQLQRTGRYMPTVSEWALAAEAVASKHAPPARLVAQLPNATPGQVARVQLAKAACVAQLRARGWAKLADTIEAGRIAIPVPPTCDVCDDTGWRPRMCTAATRCGRLACAPLGSDYEHDYVERCACVDTNETITARRARAAIRQTSNAQSRGRR